MADGATGPSTPAQRFKIIEGLRIVDFDDDCVVFEPCSWDAHLLNPAAAAVLDLLHDGAKSMADVEAFLAEALDPSERAHAAIHADRLMSELLSLGLVRLASEQPHALD